MKKSGPRGGEASRSRYLSRKRDPRDANVTRVYFRVGEKYVPMRTETGGWLAEGSETFNQLYDDLLAEAEGRSLPSLRKPNTRTPRPNLKNRLFAPGTIGWLVPKFRGSAKWAAYGDGTKYLYTLALDLLRTHLGHYPIVDLDNDKVNHYTAKIERLHGGSVADQQKAMISLLWEESADHPEVKRNGKINPTIDTKTRYRLKRETKAWPVELYNRFLATAKHPLTLAVELLYYTGQRGGDAVKFMWSDLVESFEEVDGEKERRVHLRITQEKTGKPMWLRLPDPLIERLEREPRISEYILTNIFKRPWENATTLSHAIRRHLETLGYGKKHAREYSMHGLRATAARDIASIIPGTAGVKAVTGHVTDRLARKYSQDFDQKRVNDDVVGVWNADIRRKAAKANGGKPDLRVIASANKKRARKPRKPALSLVESA